MIWRIDYVVGNTYKVKYITAETAEQAIKKARVKNIVDLNIQESRCENIVDLNIQESR